MTLRWEWEAQCTEECLWKELGVSACLPYLSIQPPIFSAGG